MGRLTINYEIAGMELIEQDKDGACWYAAVLMLMRWKHRKLPGGWTPPVEDETLNLYKLNEGLDNTQIVPLAKRLGLKPIPPMSPSVEGMRSWLFNHGPLWTNGQNHVVVIAGICGDEQWGYSVKVYDPWPGRGVSWRSLLGWYAGMDPNQANESTRDTSPVVQAVFLHC